MNQAPVLVTGASGQLGRRVVELLLERAGTSIIATTRNPDALKELTARGVDVRRADFDDPASLTEAFRGAERALLISTDTLLEPGRRVRQHRAAVEALAAAGTKHVVYTSLLNADRTVVKLAPDHAATEAALVASALDFTVLRNSVYTDLMTFSLPAALARGQIVDARGAGKVSFVTREDCARTAAAALVDPNASGRLFLDVTGPQAVSSEELAGIVSQVFERDVKHVSASEQDLVAAMTAHGTPEPIAAIYASFDVAAANGELATVSGTVQRLTGRAPESVREFLVRNRAAILAAVPKAG